MSLPISTSSGRHARAAAGSALSRLVGESLEPVASNEGKEILVLEVRSTEGQSLSTLALASVLAQHEEAGDRVEAIRLLVRHRDDADWVVPLVEWARERGLVVVLRSRVRLRPDLVECLRHESVPVEFELAHHDGSLQRILLDGQADPVQALLLQSQHLAMIGIEQSVRFGPLLPGVHDEEGFRRLLALARGAGVERYSLVVGQLRSEALNALGGKLGSGQALALTRAFRVSPMVLFEGLEASLRLPPMMRVSLDAAYQRLISLESNLRRSSVLGEQLDRQGRGSAVRGALALELFADPSLAAS